MELTHNECGPSYIIMHVYHSINLSKAQNDAMEIMDSTNDKAKQKTNFVCVSYVKMGLFGKSTLHP